jgi:hypothetical protein
MSNLIGNPGFENAPAFTAATNTNGRFIDGTAGGSLTNSAYSWLISGAQGTMSAQFDNSTSHSGTYSLKLSTLAVNSYIEVNPCGQAGKIIGYWGKAIPVIPSTAYPISYWMKTNYVSGDSNSGAYITSIESDSLGNNVNSTAQGPAVKTTTGWTQYGFTKVTASNTAFMQIQMPIYGHTGTGTLIMDAWFDDLYLDGQPLNFYMYNNPGMGH